MKTLNFGQCKFIDCDYSGCILKFDNIKNASFEYTYDSNGFMEGIENNSLKVIYKACARKVSKADSCKELSIFKKYNSIGLERLPERSGKCISTLLNLSQWVSIYRFPLGIIRQIIHCLIELQNNKDEASVLGLLKDMESPDFVD